MIVIIIIFTILIIGSVYIISKGIEQRHMKGSREHISRVDEVRTVPPKQTTETMWSDKKLLEQKIMAEFAAQKIKAEEAEMAARRDDRKVTS